MESHCRYDAPLAFPEPVTAGLAVTKLGRSSVTYRLAVFGDQTRPAPIAALGLWVHVYVDRAGRRPTAIPAAIRDLLGTATV